MSLRRSQREIVVEPRGMFEEEEEEEMVIVFPERVPRPITEKRRRKSRFVPRRQKETVVEETVVVKSEEDNVEEELRQSGYSPVSKIIVSQDGDMEGRYVKALNLYGQYVYVELDTEGVISIDGDVVTHTEVLEATELPLIDAYKCVEGVEGSVCGVASECRGGICTLKRESESKYPRQTVLRRSEKMRDTSSYATLAGDEVAYPIVRLSEIRSNPERALLAQNEATTLLRNQRNQSLLADVDEMSNLLTQLVEEFNDFDELREELTFRVENDLAELEADNLSYVNDPPVGEAERNQAEDIIEGLTRRNDIVIDILECTKTVTDLNDTLRKAVATIQNAKKMCLQNVNI